MKKTLTLLAAALLLAACGGPSREKQIADIERQEEQISTADINAQDEDIAPLVQSYTRFANDFADDSLAPVYLQRAADLCISLGNTDRAISLLDSVVSLYTGYEDVAGCYFLKGYAYETAEQYDKAAEAYTYFVDNYPDHPLASDTRLSIQYLGMSAEEMLEAILASNAD